MDKLTDKLLIFPILAILLGGEASAGVADNPVTQVSEPQDLVQQARFSPREYCRTSGGVVSETQISSIYLCCYKSKSRCVVTDIKQSVSWPIPYSERNRSHLLMRFK